MVHIKTINSEVDIRQNIAENFKQHRTLKQSALYLDDGADYYYNPDKKFSGERYDYFKITQMLESIITKDKEGARTAIISLGCGSCEKDKILIEKLQESGHNISFFGVDTSMSMIQKAYNVLKDVTFEATLICADFSLGGFREQLDSIVGEYETGIYLFLGNTFGNIDQSYIADILKNVLHIGDHLLLDVIGFETITPYIQTKLFQRYQSYLDNPADIEFSLYPLKFFGIQTDGKRERLTLEVSKDSASQARVFIFGFFAGTSVDFNVKNEVFNLTPTEHVKLRVIMIYDLQELEKFLDIKNFKLKAKIVGNFLNQFLLERQ